MLLKIWDYEDDYPKNEGLGSRTRKMKNLEIKFQLLSEDVLDIGGLQSGAEWGPLLIQEDRYYSCLEGRCKLRKQRDILHEKLDDHESLEMIRYNRPDVSGSKLSEYSRYPIPRAQASEYFRVIGDFLHEELRITKLRSVFWYKNARIHVDRKVIGKIHDKSYQLGRFLEIEVVIQTDEEEREADTVLQEALQLAIVNLTNVPPTLKEIFVGYRELAIREHRSKCQTIHDFLNSPDHQLRLFWVLNSPVTVPCGQNQAASTITLAPNQAYPCIFVVEKDGNKDYELLQIDLSIRKESTKYTMWRRMVGKHYGVRVGVLLLIKLDKNSPFSLVDLHGSVVNPSTVGRSDVYVHRSFLAPFQ